MHTLFLIDEFNCDKKYFSLFPVCLSLIKINPKITNHITTCISALHCGMSDCPLADSDAGIRDTTKTFLRTLIQQATRRFSHVCVVEHVNSWFLH